jgi:hypothetical protein
MTDGSVRFVKNSISQVKWSALGPHNGESSSPRIPIDPTPARWFLVELCGDS